MLGWVSSLLFPVTGVGFQVPIPATSPRSGRINERFAQNRTLTKVSKWCPSKGIMFRFVLSAALPPSNNSVPSFDSCNDPTINIFRTSYFALLDFISSIIMPGFVKKAHSKAGPKAKAKPRPKRDAKARAEAVYDDLQVLAEQEEAPKPLTAADIEKILIPSSYKQYTYTMRLWRT
jgi:hypothetical protein